MDQQIRLFHKIRRNFHTLSVLNLLHCLTTLRHSVERKSHSQVSVSNHKLVDDVLDRRSTDRTTLTISNALPQKNALARILLLRELEQKTIKGSIGKQLQKKQNKQTKCFLSLSRTSFKRSSNVRSERKKVLSLTTAAMSGLGSSPLVFTRDNRRPEERVGAGAEASDWLRFTTASSETRGSKTPNISKRKHDYNNSSTDLLNFSALEEQQKKWKTIWEQLQPEHQKKEEIHALADSIDVLGT